MRKIIGWLPVTTSVTAAKSTASYKRKTLPRSLKHSSCFSQRPELGDTPIPESWYLALDHMAPSLHAEGEGMLPLKQGDYAEEGWLSEHMQVL